MLTWRNDERANKMLKTLRFLRVTATQFGEIIFHEQKTAKLYCKQFSNGVAEKFYMPRKLRAN